MTRNKYYSSTESYFFFTKKHDQFHVPEGIEEGYYRRDPSSTLKVQEYYVPAFPLFTDTRIYV